MAITGKRKRLVILIAVLAAGVLAAAVYRAGGRDKTASDSQPGTFTVSRGDLVMSVTESGTIKARNAVEVKSQVEGSATIISLVPEGSRITAADVAAGKTLVELDSSNLRDQINQQEITFNSAEADYTEARESLNIQKNQNDSDTQQGLLNVKFARMDLQKYLGRVLADALVNEYTLTAAIPKATDLLDDPNQLGGSSLQRLREMESDIDLAEEDYKRAETDLGWTEKLYQSQYVSRSELESDQLKVKRLRVNWNRALTSLELFMKYDFPKEAEKLFSDYLEAERELERIKARTRSRLAQAEARLRSSEAKYQLNKERLERIRSQIAACVMRATEPGLVIYASSNNRWGGSRTRIEVGGDVRERELIMTITNADEMDVDVKVHETNVDKVRLSQIARIVIDAQPDKVFHGSVLKIAPLPDPQSFFGNPDLKVYSTDVSLEGADASIKPGMNARVEILIAELTDVLSIPVQCVANRDGQKVCFVAADSGPQQQVVETGVFNDRFVQILSGLEAGQKVLLNPPRLLLTGGENAVPKRHKKAQQDGAENDVQADSEDPATAEPAPETLPDAPAGGMPERFKKMDQNADGKLSLADEVPAPAQAYLKPLDTNQDGFLDAAEIAAAAKKMGGSSARPGRPARERQP